MFLNYVKVALSQKITVNTDILFSDWEETDIKCLHHRKPSLLSLFNPDCAGQFLFQEWLILTSSRNLIKTIFPRRNAIFSFLVTLPLISNTYLLLCAVNVNIACTYSLCTAPIGNLTLSPGYFKSQVMFEGLCSIVQFLIRIGQILLTRHVEDLVSYTRLLTTTKKKLCWPSVLLHSTPLSPCQLRAGLAIRGLNVGFIIKYINQEMEWYYVIVEKS